MEATCVISLDAITKNFQYFSEISNKTQVIPVVKANAYGHGAIAVSQHLVKVCGVKLLAVATLEEAQELAPLIPEASILIFSRVFPAELQQLPDNAILTIGSMDDAHALLGSGQSGLKVHLNVNTGMNRLGISAEQAQMLISDPQTLDIQGVYSHFSSSDTASEKVYHLQLERFNEFVQQIQALGYQGMIHLSNSAGSLHNDSKYYDAIRLGIGLYGYDTSAGAHHQKHLTPAMEVQAPLVRVERIAAGESVSYAEKWQASVDTNIGTLRIGYADGYSRSLTNRGTVQYEGIDYPVIGTVTMDHIMIDLGTSTPQTGSLFTVMGGSSKSVQIASIAKKLNTITYEICCGISPRVRRLYKD